MSGSVKRRVFVYVQRNSDRWVAHRLARVASTYLEAFRNNDHNLHQNGEVRLIERLPAESVSCAFDVGGFQGEWTRELLASQPGASVHCFEISPETAHDLEAKMAGNDRVRVNRFGLGSVDGEQPLFIDQVSPDVNSLVKRPDADLHEVVAKVRRGDDYTSEHGIDHIDLLKVDTEGHDIEVLRGFAGMLASGSISMIQFEYNRWNLVARVLLADFYDLLEPLGYTIGKVRWNSVDFKPYSADDETWVGPACCAVHQSRADLIAVVS